MVFEHLRVYRRHGQRVPVTPLAAGDAFSADYAILRRTILRQGFL